MQAPGIGLLSIGEEGGKGNELVRQAHSLYESSGLDFVGNVEGRDIFTGEVEIIVCDGFVGNVALKLTERMADIVTEMVERELQPSLTEDEADSPAGELLGHLRKYWDYQVYGGAPLLGINGVGIVCHGGSSPKAIANALLMADHYAEHGIAERLSEEMLQFRAQESIFGIK
jgi:glycerol-3-phosphate acyltransferase PlsX